MPAAEWDYSDCHTLRTQIHLVDAKENIHMNVRITFAQQTSRRVTNFRKDSYINPKNLKHVKCILIE